MASPQGVEITLENIEQAIHQLYYDQNLSSKDAAQKWLMVVQRSPEAWQFSWSLLTSDKPTEVQYFGALALCTKISRFWGQLSPDQYQSLREQLFQQIFTFASTSKIVLTRLCVAMSALCLHTMADTWPSAIRSMITTLLKPDIQLDTTQRYMALLELMTVLPEEFNTAEIPLAKKSAVRREMQQGAQDVLGLLQSLLEREDLPTSVRHQAMKCLSSWAQFGLPIDATKPFLGTAFDALCDPELFDTAVETLINMTTSPTIDNYPQLIFTVIEYVLGLRGMINKAIEDKDTETCQGLCRLVVSIGESHSRQLLQGTLAQEHRQSAIQFVSTTLQFSTYPGYFPVDENFSNLPFGFWYILQDDLLAMEPEEFGQLMLAYAPTYMQLVAAILEKVQYPPDDEYEEWSSEDKERFRCYRQDNADSLMYAYGLLKDTLLHSLYSKLAALDEQASWQSREACLFAFRAITEGGEFGEDNSYIQGLLNSLAQMPLTHMKLATATMFLLGTFSPWYLDHPDTLRSVVIPLLLSGLRNSELAVATTMALKEICSECLPHLPLFANEILSAGQAVLSSNILRSRECVRLMTSIGYVLSTLPLQEIIQYLEILLTPQLQQLQALTNEEPSVAVKAGIEVKLHMLAMLFASLDTKRAARECEADVESGIGTGQPPPVVRSADESQPVLIVLQQVLPIIKFVLGKWMADPGVVEAVCDVLKRAITTLLDEISALIPQLVELLVEIYDSIPQTPILDLAKHLTGLFGDSDPSSSSNQAVKVLFAQLTNKTLRLFHLGPQEHTEIIASFMEFAAQVIKKHPQVFLTCSQLMVFEGALVALNLPETPTIRAATHFFIEFIKKSAEIPVLDEIMNDYGKNLLEFVLKGVGGQASRQVMDNMADIIMALNKYCSARLCRWTPQLMMASAQFPSSKVTKEQKDQFTKDILRERANKRKLRDIINEFTLKCRGIFGTEYGKSQWNY